MFRTPSRRLLTVALTAIGLGSLGCPPPPIATATHVLPGFGAPSKVYDSCLYASPLAVESQGSTFILAMAVAEGTVDFFAPDSGALAWSVKLPVPDGEGTRALATPVVADRRAYIGYHTVEPGVERTEHRVVAIDLEKRELDADFEMVVLDAEKPAFDPDDGIVEFNPPTALGRATLVHAVSAQRPDGYVYVSFGNSRDIQPWHGWVFELDVEAWRSGSEDDAVTSVLLTTPETYCPVEGESGSRDMICGGGVWAPSGPVVIQGEDDFELIVPTGNGQLDLLRNDYANTLMRMTAGLDFDPGCDMEDLCADFDPIAPSDACTESCSDLFIPRLAEGDEPLTVASGKCDDVSFFECYALLDYDLGANSPIQLELDSGTVFVLPAKDGAVYLVDDDHLGTMLDREVIMDQCGATDDKCKANWAGTMVTQPATAVIDGDPVVFIATFIRDETHPAGVVALTVTDGDDGPRLEPRWTAPDFDAPDANTRFRWWPGRPIVTIHSGEPVVWVHEARAADGRGRLLGILGDTGEILVDEPLFGAGRRFVKPALVGSRLFLNSCDNNDGPGALEAFDLGGLD